MLLNSVAFVFGVRLLIGVALFSLAALGKQRGIKKQNIY